MGAIIKLVISLLAGVGGGAILDKVAADKLPAYPAGGVAPYDSNGQIDFKKVAWFVVAAVASTMIVKFIGKKLNIKILR